LQRFRGGSDPRERWYNGEFRSVIFGWLMGAALLAWGVEGFSQSPVSEVPLDLLKLVGGMVLLLWTVRWVRRPVKKGQVGPRGLSPQQASRARMPRFVRQVKQAAGRPSRLPAG
jgi:hypothetical protein